MSAVRRWTWPIVTPGSIGLGARSGIGSVWPRRSLRPAEQVELGRAALSDDLLVAVGEHLGGRSAIRPRVTAGAWERGDRRQADSSQNPPQILLERVVEDEVIHPRHAANR